MRAFLLTLAVVDDLATIVVIALFFGESIDASWLMAAAAATVLVAVCARAGIARLPVYVLLAGAFWFALYNAGVHPTITGVLLGSLTPASTPAGESESPLERRQRQLHPWSGYAVLPIFALANAGVPVSLGDLGDALSRSIGLGIALGLVIGAPLAGIVVSYGLVRAHPRALQRGLDWFAIAAVAPLKGIGFTVAIFISVLAFENERALQDQAKLATSSRR